MSLKFVDCDKKVLKILKVIQLIKICTEISDIRDNFNCKWVLIVFS